jgi:hypothetical protein
LSLLADEPGEWFADDAGGILGAIVYHSFSLDWSLIVLRINREGKCSSIDRNECFVTPGEARRLLLEQMAIVVETAPEASQPAENARQDAPETSGTFGP